MTTTFTVSGTWTTGKAIMNFYCVQNALTKDTETESFKHYKKLRDGDKAFYLSKGCSRRWLISE